MSTAISDYSRPADVVHTPHTPTATDTDLSMAKGYTESEERRVEYNDVLGAPDIGLSANLDEGFDPAFVKSTMRKVDWRLIPILSAMYCVSLVDRTNLSLARQANNMHMDKELGTNLGDRYSIITLIFFVPYVIFEVPSQLGIRKFGARYWLGGATTLWGIVMLAMGFAHNWQTLAALRAILGLFESALFPGAAFLISCWYARREMAVRNTVFYCIAGIVGVFGTPIGYAMSLLHGRGGISGWSWIFVFFGIITILVGLVGLVYIVDFPDKATFLTEEQRHLIHARIQRDRGDADPDPVTLAKLGRYLSDWRIWVYGLMFMSSTMASYSLAYFLPVILASMGFNNVESMMLNVPSTVWAFVPALGTAYLADRVPNARGWCVAFNALCVIIGTCMYSQLPMSQKAARYVGIFFAVGGCNANIPNLLAWAQTSIRAQSKRAVFAAVVVAWGGVGGILAGVVFIQKEAMKGYPTGVWFTVGMNAFTMVASISLSLFYRYKNKRAERREAVLEGSEDFRYQP